MGKAARRKKDESRRAPAKAPFVARPFEGLDGEGEWVAMKEFVPSATAAVTVMVGDAPREVEIVTLLPLTWPALHRADGTILAALQSHAGSGDPSRDIAQAILAAAELEPGNPVTGLRPATAETPRLQDIVQPGTFRAEVLDTFEFWIAPEERTEESAAQLEQANAAIIPNGRVEGVEGVFWARLSGRTYLRWVLTEDEDAARDAIARLWAAGEHTPGEGSAFLGAFRAAGLLVPVIEIPNEDDPATWSAGMKELVARYEKALAETTPLTPDEKRVREAMSSRQITLR